MRKNIIITLILVGILLLAACSKKSENTETPNPSEEPKQEEQPELFTYPFTGLETEEEPTNRAIAVMVNNQKQARPQSGLHEADIVFEMLAEGDITRFLAIYQSTIPERVGPVRSAREYYFRLADGYDAIYVYHGAAGFIDDMIRQSGIDFLNGAHYDNDKQLFIRESFRVAPHNSYLLIQEAYNRAESKGYEITENHKPLPFLAEGDTVSGEDAPYVKISYFHNSTIVEYKYDDASGTYYRYSDGEQTVDLETETPIQVNNVFIVEADHQVIDKQGRRAIDLQSGGFGYLLQQGKVQQVQWENQDGLIVPVKDGQVVPFVQGKTWINVIQTQSDVEQVQLSEFNE
mgnify:CR=1 FL=1